MGGIGLFLFLIGYLYTRGRQVGLSIYQDKFNDLVEIIRSKSPIEF
jgi:hypothetical protein